MSEWAGNFNPSLTSRVAILPFIALGLLGLLHPPATAQDEPAEPPALEQPVTPPTDFAIADVPNDAGHSLRITWSPSQSPASQGMMIAVLRSESPNGPFSSVDTVKASAGTYVDGGVTAGKQFYYQLNTVGPGQASTTFFVGPGAAVVSWFNTGRTSVAFFTLVFFALVLFFFWVARQGRELYVRRIPGIDAIEEAVGRATEMGRPVLYIPGIQDIDDIQTMASLIILENVSEMTAQYETKIIVPTNYPVVMTLAQEMVKNGHLRAGRPDAYDEDSVRYVTTEQFAYVAAVNGIMLRDKPAANIFLGPFFAESLILAETGYSTKAIQVAGTANVHQLPFFVVACDYTLIGEELYAASAYLSKEPKLLSTLKGSDFMKVFLIFVLVMGSVLESLGITGFTTWMTAQ